MKLEDHFKKSKSELETVIRESLPYDPKETAQLVEWVRKQKKTSANQKSSKTNLMVAIENCCDAALQSEAVFPPFITRYGIWLREVFEKRSTSEKEARLFEELFKVQEKNCGLNRMYLDDLQTIHESEKDRQRGIYDRYLKKSEKFDEYETRLMESDEFHEDWRRIKETFPRETAETKLIKRSLIPERTFVKNYGASFKTRKDRFQAIFDFFCWKYFLYGMKESKPYLDKMTVLLTPHGTQIFIPGYMSLDSKRDLNFQEITKLHRSRGILRQGPTFSQNRARLKERSLHAFQFHEEATRAGLKGRPRLEYIEKKLGWRFGSDYRYLRTLISKGRKERKPQTTHQKTIL
jgi:hypothetical protein